MKDYSKWRDVPIPDLMADLPRDKRGYPIPFVVMRDRHGDPIFTINDHELVDRSLADHLCSVCGNPLEHGSMHFLGGPIAAFHPQGGVYIDGPIHRECGRYSLQVCPYLAAPSYTHRIDAAQLNKDRMPGDTVITVDQTVMPERPECFVMIECVSYSVDYPWHNNPLRKYRPISAESPNKKFHDFEVWVKGDEIEDEEEAVTLVRKVIQLAPTRKIIAPKFGIIQPGERVQPGAQ